MSADRLALAVRVRKARRRSACTSCGSPIQPGQHIARLSSPPGWVHVACVPIVSRYLGQAAQRAGDQP
jgi:hypothetical protein